MLSRRDFVKQATLISLAPTVPAFLARTARGASPSPDERILVVIQLDGGNDGLNTVIPYTDDNYTRLRPKLAVPHKNVRRLNDAVGLNPAMWGAEKSFHEGRLAIVQGVGYPNPNKSHDVSNSIWQTARFDDADRRGYGWIGRGLDDDTSRRQQSGAAALLIGSESVPAALRGRKSVAASLASLEEIVINGSTLTDASPAPHPAPAAVSSGAQSGGAENLADFIRRSNLDARVMADRLKGLARQKSDSADGFQSDLGNRLSLIARLIQSDFGARVYYAVQSGYDTHVYQRETHDRLLGNLSQAIRQFFGELKRAKLDDRVALMTFSEFGRRADENGSEGTDHGAAAPLFLAGPKVKAGLHGVTPNLAKAKNGDLVATVDFRQVYQSVLEDWLRLPAASSLGGKFPPLKLF